MPSENDYRHSAVTYIHIFAGYRGTPRVRAHLLLHTPPVSWQLAADLSVLANVRSL